MLLFPLAGIAIAADPRVHDAVQPLTRRHLRVTQVDGAAFAEDGWALTGPDGVTHAASDVRTRTRAAALVPEGWPYPSVPEHVAIVAFDAPWAGAPGNYVLSVGGRVWSFAWDPSLDLAPSVHLSPSGSRPDAPQHLALASVWNVDGPAVSLSGESWSVIDEADGSVARTGTWQLRAAADNVDDAYGNSFTRADVHAADLTGLPEGTYHLRWEGVGRSWTFRVADDVWDIPFRTVLIGLLNQRCGTDLPAELTRWSRPACHLAPIERTTADYRVVGEDAFSELPAAATGAYVEATGGYHDAADYDRNIAHLAVVHAFVELHDADPARFANDALGLPESGNGLPDLLDEALWAMRPWAALQDEGGGVPGGIGTTAYPAYTTMPEADEGRWYATASDPYSSYVFAAAGASLARALRQTGEDVAADAWLARAEAAWGWAEAHPASLYDTDVPRAHAAAELVRATSASAYADAFRASGPFADGTAWSYAPWDPTDWDDALWAMANADAAPADLRDAARRVLLERADEAVSQTDARSVPLAVRPYAAVAFGSGSTPRESRVLFRAHQLTGASDYLRVGTLTAAHTLGLNATGTGWVTGLGPNAVRFPLHTPSLADGIDDPLAGIPVYGPASYDSSDGVLGAALAAYAPSVADWPLHARFADVSYVPVYNEFTVTESLAPTLYAFGYLAALEDASGDTGVDAGSDDVADSGRAEGCGCAGRSGPVGVVAVALGVAIAVARRRERA